MYPKINLNELSVKTTNQVKAAERLKIDLNFYKEDSFNGTSLEASYGEIHIILISLNYANS